MKANSRVRLKFPSKKHLNVVFESLEPEVRRPPTVRSQASLEKERTSLILRIEAADTTALRAAMNAYLRWIDSTKNILETLESLS